MIMVMIDKTAKMLVQTCKITKVEWSVRSSKLAEEDNCCGVVEVEDEDEEQHAGHVDDQEGGQQPGDQEGGELLTDQVHSRLHADLADCQQSGGGGESNRGIDENSDLLPR